MKTYRTPKVYVIFLCLSILFYGCKKEAASLKTDNIVKPANLVDTNSYVITPAGKIPKSHIFMIEKGSTLTISNEHAYKTNIRTGEIEKDFGEIHFTRKINTNSLNTSATKNTDQTNSAKLPQLSGWITYASWQNQTFQAITSFSTDYTVPNAPSNIDGQLIYYFEGLQYNSNDIMQPVLQWGNNGHFGGSYWSIANWYVWSVQNPNGTTSSYGAFSQPTTGINAGTVLHGKITYTGQKADGSFNYTSSFTNYPASDLNITEGTTTYNGLTIPSVQQQNWAFETLEAYKSDGSPELTYYADYPAQSYGKMSNITLLTNNQPAPLQWTPTSTQYATLGESTSVISNNSSGTGQVNLYGIKPVTIPVVVTMPSAPNLHAVVVSVGAAVTPIYSGANFTFTSSSTQNYIAYEISHTYNVQVTTVTQRCHVTLNNTYTQDTQGGHSYVSFNNISLNGAGTVQISVVPF